MPHQPDLPFGGHHVRVEAGWTPDGLARVVDDEVEALARSHELAAERFHAGRVAQVEAEDLEPVRPIAEVGLLRIARGGVAREPRRDDQLRARAEKLQSRLVADLDATAGDERNPPAQVRKFGARGEIEIGAGGAQLIVEVVNAGVSRLADVADARRGSGFVCDVVLAIVRREMRGREHVRRGDDGAPAQPPDAGLVQHRLCLPDTFCSRGLLPFPLRPRVRYREPGECLMQAAPILRREPLEQPPVGSDLLQHVDGGAQLLVDAVVRGRGRVCRDHRQQGS